MKYFIVRRNSIILSECYQNNRIPYLRHRSVHQATMKKGSIRNIRLTSDRCLLVPLSRLMIVIRLSFNNATIFRRNHSRDFAGSSISLPFPKRLASSRNGTSFPFASLLCHDFVDTYFRVRINRTVHSIKLCYENPSHWFMHSSQCFDRF